MMAIWLTIIAAAVTALLGVRWFRTLPSPSVESVDAGHLEQPRFDIKSVENRIETQLAVLDELILEADAEITRLEAAILSSRWPQATNRSLTPAEQQRCFAMREAGFDVDEIADCLATTPSSVAAALDEWRTPQRFAA